MLELAIGILVIIILVYFLTASGSNENFGDPVNQILMYSRTGGEERSQDYLMVNSDRSYIYRRDYGRGSVGALDNDTWQAVLWLVANSNRFQGRYCQNPYTPELYWYVLDIGGRRFDLGYMFSILNDNENYCLPPDMVKAVKKLEEFVQVNRA